MHNFVEISETEGNRQRHTQLRCNCTGKVGTRTTSGPSVPKKHSPRREPHTLDMTCPETHKTVMIDQLLAGSGVSISDLKKNPTAVIEAAGGFPVAVLNRNTPAAYLVPAKAWEELMDRLEDIELAELVRSRSGETPVRVALDDL